MTMVVNFAPRVFRQVLPAFTFLQLLTMIPHYTVKKQPYLGKLSVKFDLCPRIGLSLDQLKLIYIHIYITNCRQYCFGLLGLISAVLMLEWR